MAFQFAPTTNVNAPAFSAPQSAQMGATVDANPISAMANLANVAATKQSTEASELSTRKARETFGADVAKAQADSERAQTEAKKAAVTLGNEQISTMYSVLAPYASDERLLKAGSLNGNSTPNDFKAVQNDLYDVSDEIDQSLQARGWGKADRRQYITEFNAAILKDPRQAPELIKRATQTLAGAANIAEQNQPQYEKNAAGQIIGIKKAQQKISPIGDSSGIVNPTSGGVASTNEYIKDLNLRNSTALETDMRLGEAEGLLKLIKGGAGTKNFTEIARWAQAANLPTALVDSIAGGDISAVQAAQKFITTAVIQGATANPGTAESVNRFIKDNPDIGTDPRALDKFIKFTQKLNQKTFDETEFLLSKKKSGQFNPETHVQETQQYLRGKYLNPETKSSESKPSEGKQTVRKVVRTGKDSAGREVVQYDDGTIGYK
jgi:hypothetical protein